MRLPNLHVIGVSRAGTSALFDYLGRHPDIGGSDRKEVRYFTPLRHGGLLDPPLLYAQHFAGRDERYLMEATPGYFYGGKKLAQAMWEVCERPKVILSLREPVSRCWSWYRFERDRMRLPKDTSFNDYVAACLLLNSMGRDGLPEYQAYWGIGGGTYDRWLDDWISLFEDRLRVIFFDDLTADPAGVTTDLYRWLDLDPTVVPDSDFAPVNTTHPYRFGLAQRAAVSVNRRGEAFFRRHPALKRRLRSGYYGINSPHTRETMSAEARKMLGRFYEPHNQRLGKQLDRIGLAVPPAWRLQHA